MPSKFALRSALLALSFGVSAPALAVMGASIEPVIGYERSQRLVPTPHSHDHLVYGGRLLVGIPLISAEAEYLHGNDSESFSTGSPSATEDRSDSVKLGLRSTISLMKVLSFHARGGAQAKRIYHSETVGGVTTGAYDPIKYNPYAGAGLAVRLTSHIRLNSDLTVVFPDFPHMDHNEYQATAGFTVSFP